MIKYANMLSRTNAHPKVHSYEGFSHLSQVFRRIFNPTVQLLWALVISLSMGPKKTLVNQKPIYQVYLYSPCRGSLSIHTISAISSIKQDGTGNDKYKFI